MNAVVLLSLRLASSAVFFFSSVLIMLSGDKGVYRLTDTYGFSWLTADPSLRFLLMLAIFSGASGLIGLSGRFSKSIRLLTSIFMFGDAIAFLFTAERYSPVFFPEIPAGIALVLGILVFVSAFLNILDSHSKKHKPYVLPLLWLAAIGLTFARPVYIDDWTDTRREIPEEYQFRADSLLSVTSPETAEQKIKLAAFFTTGCPHCKSAAGKLGVAYRTSNLNNVILFFPESNEEKIPAFLHEADAEKLPYRTISKGEFISFTRGRYPAFYLFEHDDIHIMRGASAINHDVLGKLGSARQR